MSNFKVGDKVVCIDPVYGHLEKDHIYTVCVISKCVCGPVEIGWGQYHNMTNATNICTCGVYKKTTGQYVAKASRFRKIEPAKPSYRIATLEILTQLPTIKETSDQPINVPTETEHA